eukprot:gene2695-3498_t
MSAPPKHPSHQPLPEGVVSLSDHEAHARGRLDAATWAYLCGAAADELTFAGNQAAWRQLPLLPRVLRPLASGHTRVELLAGTPELLIRKQRGDL